MVKFEPVDYNPFEEEDTSIKLEEVDYNPFEETPEPSAVETPVERDLGLAAKLTSGIPVIGPLMGMRGVSEHERIEQRKAALNTMPEGFVPETDLSAHQRGFIQRSDELTEKQRKFSEYYPEGELKAVPYEWDTLTGKKQTETEIYRTSPDQPWRPLDEEAVTLEDVVEFTYDDAPVIAAEVGAFYLTGGVPLIKRALATASTVALTRMASEQAEELAGYQDTPLMGQVQKAGIEAAATLGTELVAGPLGAGVRGTIPTTKMTKAALEEAKLVVDYIEQEGIETNLTAGQISSFLQRAENKAEAITGLIGAKKDEQAKAMIEAMERDYVEMLSQAEPLLSDATLRSSIDKQKVSLLDDLSKPATTLEQGAEAAQEGYAKWVTETETQIDDIYNEALGYADEVTFNLAPLKANANELKAKAAAPFRQTITEVNEETGEEVLKVVDRTFTTSEQKSLNQFLDVIEEVDLLQEGVQGYEALKGLRSKLNDFAYPRQAGEVPSTVQKYAQGLSANITKTIEKPLGDFSQEFSDTWLKGNVAHKEKMKVLQMNAVKNLRGAEELSTVVPDLFDPKRLTSTKQILEALPADKRTETVDAFKAYLLSDLDNLGTNLNKFIGGDGPEVLGLALSPEEVTTYRLVADQVAQINNGITSKLLKRADSAAQRALSMAQDATSVEMDEFVKEFGEEGRTALKAAIMKDLSTKVVKTTGAATDAADLVTRGTKRGMDFQAYVKEVDSLKKKDWFTNVFTEPEIESLSRKQAFSAFISAGQADPGASLQAAELVATILSTQALSDPRKWTLAFLDLKAQNRLAKMFVSPVLGNIILSGRGAAPEDATKQLVRGSALFLNRLTDYMQDVRVVEEDSTDTSSELERLKGLDMDKYAPEYRNYLEQRIQKLEDLDAGQGDDTIGGGADSDFMAAPEMGDLGSFMDKYDIPEKPMTALDEEPAKEGSIEEALNAAVDTSGVDYGVMRKIAMAESSLNPKAKAKTSSASGLFQITSGTWKSLVKKYGADLGVAMGDRMDPIANAKMAGVLMKENKDAIERKLGREAKPGELYAAHFLGQSAAKKLLTAPDSAIAADKFPSAAKANKPIFYKNGKARTVAEVKRVLEAKVS